MEKIKSIRMRQHNPETDGPFLGGRGCIIPFRFLLPETETPDAVKGRKKKKVQPEPKINQTEKMKLNRAEIS